MSVYVIGDTHLSLSVDKPMDIFKGWDDYALRLKNNWQRLVTDEVERNNGGTIANRYARLEARRQACKQINSMFDELDIWCDYRDELAQYDSSWSQGYRGCTYYSNVG